MGLTLKRRQEAQRRLDGCSTNHTVPFGGAVRLLGVREPTCYPTCPATKEPLFPGFS